MDILEAQARDLVLDADWRSNIYPERLVDAVAAWARRLIAESHEDAGVQHLLLHDRQRLTPVTCNLCLTHTREIERAVADSRAGALREAKAAMVTASSYDAALEAICRLAAEAEPGAQDRAWT